MIKVSIVHNDKKIKRKKKENFSCFKALLALRFLWINRGFNKVLVRIGIRKRDQGLSPEGLALATMVQPLVGSKSEKATAERVSDEIRSAAAVQKQINRFHNNPKNSYAKLLPAIVQASLATKSSDLMVIDDSPIEKCGKKMKWSGKLFNSAKQYYYHGYELVTLGFVRGRVALPIGFGLRRSQAQQGESRKTARSSQESRLTKSTVKRRKAKKTRRSPTKLKLAVHLITDAVRRGIKARHVVFDSWYCAVWLLSRLDALGLCWVTVVKRNRVFIYAGRKVNAAYFVKMTRAAGCYPRKFIAELSRYGLVAVVVNYRSNKYEVLVSNDLTLTARAVVRIYKKRWKIEVLYREAKQHYGLEKFHNQKWWAIIAHLAFSLLAQFLVRFFSIFLKNQNIETIKHVIKNSFVKIKKEVMVTLDKWEVIFYEFTNHFKISKELQICLVSV